MSLVKCVVHINRFGEETTHCCDSDSSAVDSSTHKRYVDTKFNELKARLAKTDCCLVKVENGHIGVGGKRIVGVGEAVDGHDAVTKEQLDRVADGCDVFHTPPQPDYVQIKERRRISNVGRSKESEDVVTKAELDELRAEFVRLENDTTAAVQRFTKEFSIKASELDLRIAEVIRITSKLARARQETPSGGGGGGSFVVV